MKQALYLILSIFLFASCQSNTLELNNYISEQIKIEKIKEDVFQHTSYLETELYGKVPCNGMIYVHNREAVIFDTPVNNEASEALLSWLSEADIQAVVVTHFHIDCLGGLQPFHTNEIQSYAHARTIELAKKDNQVLPQKRISETLELNIGGAKVFATFFGEGHTKDNIVGYIPTAKTLFGGCLIKALEAGKGNLADANSMEWSNTVRKIKKEMPDLETVLPGHGASGGIELLDYTIALFDENQLK